MIVTPSRENVYPNRAIVPPLLMADWPFGPSFVLADLAAEPPVSRH
jgi:hypothetical protein